MSRLHQTFVCGGFTIIDAGGRHIGAILSLIDITDQVTNAQRANYTLFGVAIILFISTLTTGIFISSSISKPIIKLRNAANDIGEGRFDTKIEIKSKDEIGELAASFNRMNAELQKTTVSKEYVDNIIRNIFGTLVVVAPDGTIQIVNKTACDLLGYRVEELVGRPVDIIFGDGTLQFKKPWLDELNGKGSLSNIETTYLTKDGKKIPVLLSGSVMRHNNSGVQGIVFVALDITERKQAEEQIRESLKEKEVLLREIHHRVKNNLQIVSSLIEHQSEYIKDKNVIDMLTESQNRILSMSLVHEKLYQSKDLSKIDFNEYINDMVAELIQSYEVNGSKITLNMNIENIPMSIDFAIPCGLIINELVTNSLKHAFPPGTQGEINIAFHSTDQNMLELVVSDNGIGIPKDLDFRKTESLGLHLITTLAENQLHGKINLNRSKGTEFQIKFRGIK